MPMNLNAPRPFTATSPVHPSYLPALHKSGRIERGIATATIAAVGIGYGLARYKALQSEQWQKQQQAAQHQTFRSADMVGAPAMAVVTVASTTSNGNSRAANEAVEDAYGDRTSLAELEAAVAAYERERKN
ncbi:uncharacterized protein GGS25DRAFT_211678 [Hypoxylon fragiforme]|uniref:uncharacterized protein n=1 Tax=Hypoxylon fragiforme TaxID=63214 RepID=UPI0020C61F1D|nr:uncharacterized protein GGS25DRAFT_211678 [Hypoxylon fragiforme]KAI2609342.1 hypothetical protein GGS25DRAFT_211678 [Hypoxylon fragiforme]